MIDIDDARLAANWRAIRIELDVPRPSRLERGLRALRVPSGAARLVAATPALRRAWYLAVAGAVLVGLGAAKPGDEQSLLTLLLLAPLLPVLGVAMAFGPAADPSYEMQIATPISGARLLAIRAATVLAVSVAGVGLPTLLSVDRSTAAVAWLLPACAVTAMSLALMTWLQPRRAAVAAAAVWMVTAFVARAATADSIAAFRPVGQIVAACVGIAAAAVFVNRRALLDRGGYVA